MTKRRLSINRRAKRIGAAIDRVESDAEAVAIWAATLQGFSARVPDLELHLTGNGPASVAPADR